MKIKQHLNFTALRKALSALLLQLPDARQPGKTSYRLHDAVMVAFACMYFQDPSLVHFQQRLQDARHRNNLMTLFDVHAIPSDNQIRNVLDNVTSVQLSPIFQDYFSRLQRGKHLKDYELLPNLYLCVIDGTQFYYSNTIHCEKCLTTTLPKGEIAFSHRALQGAIMHPGQRQVISLMPEEIANTDGCTKQDCEQAAAHRFLRQLRQAHPQLGLIMGGDALFPNQPFIEAILAQRMHYLLQIKLTDHKHLGSVLSRHTLQEHRAQDAQGRTHIYEWINAVPLNKASNTVAVNYLSYRIVTPDKNDQKRVSHIGNWVTDLTITRENVTILARGGRCRAKVENECFNTLKNQGYHLEHSYGHGKNLTFNFFVLTVLAFYLHQIFELTDKLFQACRLKLGSKRHLWETLRAYIKILIFDTWDFLLQFTLDPEKYNPVCTPPS
jgi:hypothetical protein